MTADIRYALRQIWKSPGFTLAVVLTLALGVGVNTSVFSMVNGFLLRPLPYHQPDRLGALFVQKRWTAQRTKAISSEDDNSFDAASWQAIHDSVSNLSLAIYGGANGANMKAASNAGGAVRYLEAARVSSGYFGVVGLPLLLGREFTADEDRPGGPNAVVLSHALWNAAFAEDRNILGKLIELKGESYTVVGVLGPDAVSPQRADAFTPLRVWSKGGECVGGPNCGIVARLKPGANWTSVQSQLGRIRLPYFDKFEQRSHGRIGIVVQPLQLDLAGDMRGRVEILMLAVGFILLIACANLAGLMLVRLSRRSREMATRSALGATRLAIVRQLWVESLVLAVLGGACGLLLAASLNAGLARFLPHYMVPVGGFPLDGRVIGFALAITFVTSIFFGILPAINAFRSDLRSSMASSGRTATAGASWKRQIMIGAQVALSFVLLTGAGLLARTLIHLATLPPGFDPNGVMTVKASLDSARYHDGQVFRALMRESVADLGKIPGVEHAAAALSVPYERGLNLGFRAIDGPLAGQGFGSSLTYVTPEFFAALRIPLLAGRLPASADTAAAQPVAVVNASFATHYFQTPRPIDRHVNVEDVNFTIVGIVADVAKSPGMVQNAPLSTEPMLYVPAEQTPQSMINMGHVWFQPSWIVRTSQPIAGLTHQMEKALAKADASLPISGAYSMADVQAHELRMQRIEVLLLGTLAGLALLLSAVGIYGTVANVVLQRTREMGIRLALGSTLIGAMIEVGKGGLLAAAAGLFAGALLSLLSARILAGEVYGVSVYDPVTLVGVALALGTVALGASLLPTLRISHIQLAETLMTEQ